MSKLKFLVCLHKKGIISRVKMDTNKSYYHACMISTVENSEFNLLLRIYEIHINVYTLIKPYRLTK